MQLWMSMSSLADDVSRETLTAHIDWLVWVRMGQLRVALTAVLGCSVFVARAGVASRTMK